MIILETERLTLRSMKPEDATFYLELINDPSWVTNIRDKGIHTLEAARNDILNGTMAMQEKHGFSLYAVQRKEDGAPLGMCGLIKRDSLQDVDIGYAFLPRYVGQGYAFEAASAVVRYAQSVLSLPKLAAITSPENQRSNRLLLKLGFVLEQVVVLAGEERDTNLYGYAFTPFGLTQNCSS